MKAIFLCIVLLGAGWFFFQAQNRLSDWRTDVATNQKHLEECIDEFSAIWDNFGIYTGALTAFEKSLDCQMRIIAANDRRFELLSHKPYGLPLSDSELQKLDKARMAKGDLEKVKSDLIADIKKETARLKNLPQNQESTGSATKIIPQATGVFANYPPGVDTPEKRREYLLQQIEAKKNGTAPAQRTSNRTRGY